MLPRALAWMATAAGLVFVVVVVTGGFRFELGPVRLSAHGLVPPLILMTLAGAALAWQGTARTREAFAAITDAVTRRARAIAIVSAAAVAAVGVAFGTFSASSADPSAYVDHSALIDRGQLSFDEPLARAVDWHEATWTFTPLGYRPGRAPGTIVPGYPLGLPLLMAAARRVAGERGPFWVGPVLAALAVLATYALAARFATPRAGAVAAVLLASSPILHFQMVQPMSDVPAMAWWALAIACAARRTLPSSFGAGVLAGAAVLTRPNLAPFAAVVMAVAGSDLRRLSVFIAGISPAALLLAALQRQLYGSPLQSGYGDISEFFALSNIWPNVGDYSRRILVGEGPALALAVASLVTLAIARPRTEGSTRVLAWLTAAAAAILLVLYLPYGVFPDWSSFRFLMPALPIAFAALGAASSTALERIPAPARGPVLLTMMTLIVCVNVTHAAQQSAYSLRSYEARYRTMGRHLAASLPPDAVIITAQESGSAHHYSGRPVLRWDLLAVDLDTAVARLRVLGRHPVLVVEDWEKPALRQRFPSGPTASLDWAPRAEAGSTTRVGLWDPADRGSDVKTLRLP